MKVKWTIGTTINIGNFSNIRMELSVEDDARDKETIAQASRRVFDFVDAELEAKLTETRQDLEGSVESVSDAASRAR